MEAAAALEDDLVFGHRESASTKISSEESEWLGEQIKGALGAE